MTRRPAAGHPARSGHRAAAARRPPRPPWLAPARSAPLPLKQGRYTVSREVTEPCELVSQLVAFHRHGMMPLKHPFLTEFSENIFEKFWDDVQLMHDEVPTKSFASTSDVLLNSGGADYNPAGPWNWVSAASSRHCSIR